MIRTVRKQSLLAKKQVKKSNIKDVVITGSLLTAIKIDLNKNKLSKVVKK